MFPEDEYSTEDYYTGVYPMFRSEPMTQKEFQQFALEKMKSIMNTLKEKGGHYTQLDSEAFSNFVSGAKMLDMSKEEYLIALATKHFAALVDDPQGRRGMELLHERATDLIVYMMILMAMAEDQK